MSSDPAQYMRCAGICCLVFGVLGGVVNPQGIALIATGSAILCCCPSDLGCIRCGAITAIVFSSISMVACIGIGIYFVMGVDAVCKTVDNIIDDACVSTRRRALEAPVVQAMAVSPTVLTHILDSSHVQFLATLAGGLKATEVMKDLSNMVRHAGKKPEEAAIAALKAAKAAGDHDKVKEIAAKMKRMMAGKARADAATGQVEVREDRRLQTTSNNDDCTFANDGMCDDGAPNAITSFCTCGEDLSDCGVRTDSDCLGDTYDFFSSISSSWTYDADLANLMNSFTGTGTGGTDYNFDYNTYSSFGGYNPYASCNTAEETVDDICNIYRSIGYVIIFYGGLIAACQIISCINVIRGADKTKKEGINAHV